MSMLDQIRKMADEVAVREGCTVYDIEFVGATSGRVLRVYIDRSDEQAVSVDDCSNVSRGLSLLLDVDDVIPGSNYYLEVSSPGLERVLKQPWHFTKVIGKQVNVKTFAPLIQYNPEREDLAKMKNITGQLASVDETFVRMDWNGTSVAIPFEAITKAVTVFEFVEPVKPGHGPKGKTPGGKKSK